MSAEQLRSFDEFCKYNRNTTAIRQLLEEWGYRVSQSAVQNWYGVFYPVGEEAKRFNAIASAFVGVEIGDALQKLMVINANLIDELTNALSVREGVSEMRVEQLVVAIPQLSREVRACAEAVNSLKYVRDRRALEMAGAYRAIQELRLIFTDTPFENALGEAANAVLTRLEEES